MSVLHTTLPTPIDQARTAVAAALAAEGFGILTEIDLQATMKAKLNADHEGHRILGVCNPGIAKRALDVDRNVALLLPCTVTLREVAGGTEVQVLDPAQAFTIAAPDTQTQLAPLAQEVAERLARAVAALGAH